MNDADLFDDFVRTSALARFRLQLAPQSTGVINLLDEYLVRGRAAVASAAANLPKLPPIYSDFVRSPAFNAFAFKHDSRYFIAYHDGLPVVLLIVIYRMLADRKLFPQIGNPSAESDDLPIIGNLSPNAADLTAGNARAIIAKDPDRRIYAIYLSYLVFDFLTVHEIAHVAHGHIDYRKAEYGMPYVEEVGWMPDTADGNLESQAMELDADSTATEMILKTLKSACSREQTIPQAADFYRDPIVAISNVAMAVSIMFRLFGDSRMNGVVLSAKSHPPTRWRQMQILNMLGNYVDQFWDSSLVEPAVGAFTKAIADVEAGFELITGSEQQVHGLHDAWHDEGWSYAAKVTECWNNVVREKIAKYAFIEPRSYHFELSTSLRDHSSE